MIDEVVSFIAATRNVIMEGGMAKQTFGPTWDRTAPHCLVGAMSAVPGYHSVAVRAIADAFMCRAIGELFPDRDPNCNCLVSFNDHKDTTESDIIDVMHHAIILAKEAEQMEQLT